MQTPNTYNLSGLTLGNHEQYANLHITTTYGGGTGTCYATYNGIESMHYAANAINRDEFLMNSRNDCANKAIENLKYKVAFVYAIAIKIKCWPDIMDAILYKLNNKGDVVNIRWYPSFDGDLYGEVTRKLQYGSSVVGVTVTPLTDKVRVKMCGRQTTIKE